MIDGGEVATEAEIGDLVNGFWDMVLMGIGLEAVMGSFIVVTVLGGGTFEFDGVDSFLLVVVGDGSSGGFAGVLGGLGAKAH